MEKLSSEQLLDRLVMKGTRQSEYTRELIKKKLNDEGDEIATTNLKVTVACPLGKMRMSSPCRPTTCDHLQYNSCEGLEGLHSSSGQMDSENVVFSGCGRRGIVTGINI